LTGKYHIVLNTCPDGESADRLAAALVDAGLAACINIIPGVRSVYRWQGERETAQEHLLVMKAPVARYAELEKTVVEMHPYELPEIVAVPIDRGLDGYLAWIDQSCGTRT